MRSQIFGESIACEQAHLFGQGITGKVAGEKNEARKTEPAPELLIFEFPTFADERSDPIG